MTPVIAVLATLDTKYAEVSYLAAELRSHGCLVRVVDVGTRASEDASPLADVTAAEVAAAAGEQLTQLRRTARRDQIMAAMSAGAGTVLCRWEADGDLHGVLAVGGNQGTAIATAAMRTLAFGLPKYVVSTVASGNLRGFIGDSDIAVAFSVGDLLGGPNAVTTTVLRQAAAAIAGMASVAAAEGQRASGDRRRVAVTAFGNTHEAVSVAMDVLQDEGVDVVPFHASGASGSAMERLIGVGLFDGVLDITTHEVLAELYPADIYAPVRLGRLTAAAEHGVPQVVLPGGLEYHCFAAANTIPPALRDRPIHYHNPNNTNVRASAKELTEVARVMADRLGAATAPVTVLIPELGWSHVGSPGGSLHDLACNAAFVETFVGSVPASVRIVRVPATINDPELARRAARELLRLMVEAPRQNLKAAPVPASESEVQR